MNELLNSKVNGSERAIYKTLERFDTNWSINLHTGRIYTDGDNRYQIAYKFDNGEAIALDITDTNEVEANHVRILSSKTLKKLQDTKTYTKTKNTLFFGQKYRGVVGEERESYKEPLLYGFAYKLTENGPEVLKYVGAKLDYKDDVLDTCFLEPRK